MRIKRNVIAWSLTSVVVTMVALSQSVVAVSGTWTNDASGNWSASTNWLGGMIADGAGYTADFSTIDITNDTTVTVDTPRTIGNLTFGDSDTNSAAGWIVDRIGANALTLANGTITLNPLSEGKNVSIDVPLAGNANITVKGGGSVDFSAVNTLIGNMDIGNSDNDNDVTFSTGGSAFPQQDRSFTVGEGHSGNTMTVAAGCRVAWRWGGKVGGSGGYSNNLIVTGTGAQVEIHANGGSQFNMGVDGGKANHLEVSSGGNLITQKFVIGSNGGTDNTVLITGTDSRVGYGQTSQCTLNVGTGMGGTARNSVSMDAGGSLRYQSGGTKSSGASIGDSDGADDNFILVGANSTFQFFRTSPDNPPFLLGAFNGRYADSYTGFPVDSTADGNHLDIVSGGTFATTNCSVYLMGRNSALNLGNGVGVSKATIGATAPTYGGNSYSPGIVLYKADSRLNFNSGRLTAGVPGKMVSGAGVVSNAGPAYISTDYTNTIDSVITGGGDLTKEGTGTLTLTATNTFNGDTIVSAGILGLDVPSLSDEADVYLVTGAKMDLNFGGTDAIRQLYVNGVLQGSGKYGAGERLASFFVADGPGILQVPGLVGSALIVR